MTASPEGQPPARASRHTAIGLGLTAFVLALLIYAATRLIGLTRFPIYFFTDEAVQAVAARELIRDHFRNSDGLLWPPYFKNGAVWNLSLSVYLQVLPVRLLDLSVVVTRWVSVLVGMAGVAAVAAALRTVFRARGWVLSVLVLAATPAWFLHSRTAFETAEMAAFYALFILCYLLYRTRSPRYLYAAMVFAAAAFYSYSNGQAIIGVLLLALLLVDAPYHLRVIRGVVGGLRTPAGSRRAALALLAFVALAALLIGPYIRFRLNYPTDLTYHLRSLDSYWFRDLTVGEKLGEFGRRYLQGLSPNYWFRPNDHDLIRHRMLGYYGHMRPEFLPLLLLGLVVALVRGLRFGRTSGVAPPPAAYRVVLLALLAAPVGAAMVDVAVTRVLSVVIPATLLIGLGLDWLLGVLDGLTRRWRSAAGRPPARPTLATVVEVAAFGLLAFMSLAMLRSALVDGPRWFTDYGMGGMQYGATQLFDLIKPRLAADPAAEIILSPDWANGTDLFPRFFLSPDEQQRVRTLTVDAFTTEKRPLTADMLFIMMPEEVQRARDSGKFATVDIEGTVPYPDGRPGFLLVRLAYRPDIDAVLAAEREALLQPVTETVDVDGQSLTVSHTRFEAGQLSDLFDGDAFTLVRHIPANPVRYEIVFDEPRPVAGLAADFGTMDFALTATLTPPDGEPVVYTQAFRGLGGDPHVEVPFPDAPPLVRSLALEIRDLNAGEDARIHVRELRIMN